MFFELTFLLVGGNNQLTRGISPSQVAVLAGCAIVLVAVTIRRSSDSTCIEWYFHAPRMCRILVAGASGLTEAHLSEWRLRATSMLWLNEVGAGPIETGTRVRATGSLGEQLRFGSGQHVKVVWVEPRWCKVHLADGRDHDAADQGPQGVLVVRRDDITRGPGGGVGRQDILVGAPILVPVPALSKVGGRELPVLVQMVETLEEPALLLLLRDVQEEFHDPGAIAVEMVLEAVDVLVAVLPHLSRRHVNARPA